MAANSDRRLAKTALFLFIPEIIEISGIFYRSNKYFRISVTKKQPLLMEY